MECGRMEDDFISFSFLLLQPAEKSTSLPTKPFIHSLLVRPTYLKGTGNYRDKVWVTCDEKSIVDEKLLTYFKIRF